MRPFPMIAFAVTLLPLVSHAGQAADPDLLWGDRVPDGWNGDWPAELRIVPERTDFRRTTSSLEPDGFVGWHVMDEALRQVGAHEGPAVYPVFKFQREGG